MTETQNPSVQQKPCIPTISRMKKPPVSGGLARELGCCRGTYPPPAAGCMVTAFALDRHKTKIPHIPARDLWGFDTPPRINPGDSRFTDRCPQAGLTQSPRALGSGVSRPTMYSLRQQAQSFGKSKEYQKTNDAW